jgi:putative FmdB family regulatory protein
MPLYDYRCETCEAEFEKLVSFSEADRVRCDACGEPASRQVSAPGGFAFAKGGFSASSTPKGYTERRGLVTGPSSPLAGVPKSALRDLPTVDRQGRLRDVKTGAILAGGGD